MTTDATEEQLATLIRLTERSCVVYQTLRSSPEIRVISTVEGREPPTGKLGLAALVAVLFVIAVALFASWIPARRAARIDPLEALRAE